MLDAPWVEDGKFTRVVAPGRRSIRCADLTRGGPPQWPQVFATKGTLGHDAALRDRHDRAAVRESLERPALLRRPRLPPRRLGPALHDAGRRLARRRARRRRSTTSAGGGSPRACTRRSGLVVADGQVYVLGRDQITRLHDLNGDGEADFYECVSNAYDTSPAGHDFICGLQRDAAGQLLHRLGQAGAARGSRPTARRSRCSRPASATPTAWASRPTACSPCPTPRASGPRRR